MRMIATGAMLGAALLALSGCRRPKPPPTVRIWMGPAHTCTALKAGPPVCWGSNESGQMGELAREVFARPGPVAELATAKELALGARHSCALDASGGVRCWGTDAPTIPPDLRAKKLVVRGGRTCVVPATGTELTCFGPGPAAPDLRNAVELRALAIGDAHTCVAGTFSREGAPNYDDVSCGDKPIEGLTGIRIESLVAGAQHTCALLPDRTVKCWAAWEKAASSVAGLLGAVEIAAGDRHTCARLGNGTVSCWGQNDHHQIANGTTAAAPKPVPLFGLVGVQELAGGGDGACARLGDGDIRCWGNNDKGQMGDGTLREHDVPMPVKL